MKFSIESNQELAENTPIENTASIYFDFNPAIVTNTTHNTMVSEIPMIEENSETSENEEEAETIQYETLKITPNPTSGYFTLETKDPTTLQVYNAFGQIIYEQKITENQTPIDIRHVRQGMYFLTIETEEGNIVEKIIIQ